MTNDKLKPLLVADIESLPVEERAQAERLRSVYVQRVQGTTTHAVKQLNKQYGVTNITKLLAGFHYSEEQAYVDSVQDVENKSAAFFEKEGIPYKRML